MALGLNFFELNKGSCHVLYSDIANDSTPHRPPQTAAQSTSLKSTTPFAFNAVTAKETDHSTLLKSTTPLVQHIPDTSSDEEKQVIRLP